MKTEIIITNGKAEIWLYPENDFEKTMLKDANDVDELKAEVCDTSMITYGDKKLAMRIQAINKDQK